MKWKTVEKPGWRQPAYPDVAILKQEVSGPTFQMSLRSAIANIQGFVPSAISSMKWEMLASLVVIMLLHVSGWAQDERPSAPPMPSAIAPVSSTDAASTEAQSPAGTPQLRTSSGYQLHQGDKIEIKFFYQPELNQETIVKPDGMVSLPLIGDVRAEGFTVPELEQQLTKQYAKELVDPLISIVLKEFVKPRIFIGGQVVKPGPYELRDGDMLAQALLLAGGFTPQAHRKQVLHFRPVGEGELRVTIIDMTKVYTRKPDPFLNLALQAGDLVYVPESKLSRLNQTLRLLQIQSFGFYLDPFRSRR
jgi:protein involved in polysaccharide export with SLBB domain